MPAHAGRVASGQAQSARNCARSSIEVFSMAVLWIIVVCGVLAIGYAAWATRSVMEADAGSARMQEISAAVREGAQAYLKRQYTTIGVVGIVIFAIVS